MFLLPQAIAELFPAPDRSMGQQVVLDSKCEAWGLGQWSTVLGSMGFGGSFIKF